MSRDVAYRDGYLPLFAGTELIRRSGSLTQFPADNLIGTLPPLPTCEVYVKYTNILTPNPEPSGTSLFGIGRYAAQEADVVAALQADPSACQVYSDILQSNVDSVGGLPVVPEGTAVAPLIANANFYARTFVPGGSGTGKMLITSNVGGVPTSHGFVTVNIVSGVQSLDTSGITTPLPATFSAGVCDLLAVQGDGFSTFAYLTFWPQTRPMMSPVGTVQTWIECLNGGPCA